MKSYMAIVFSTNEKAHAGLRALWNLDGEGELTVHGAAIIRRDDTGQIRVADRRTDLGLRTAMGVGIGAVLGLIAGPVGVAAGIAGASTLAAGTAVGVGVIAGGAVGLTADSVKEDQRDSAAAASFLKLNHGQSALVAEVTEDTVAILDRAMAPLGGAIHRRESAYDTTAGLGSEYPNAYLYPYYYEPFYD